MKLTDVTTGVEVLVEAIKSDYRGYMLDDDQYTDVKQNMVNEFENEIGYSNGSKYIKITTRNGNSVWGFVVKKDDGKFKSGDILKAASFNTPARNKPRGNVLNGYQVQWTGPLYLN